MIIEEKRASKGILTILWTIVLAIGALGGILCLTIIGIPLGFPLILLAGVLGIIMLIVSALYVIVTLALYAYHKRYGSN